MRQRWLSRRALGLHLAVLVVASGCLIAFWWQLHRALGGNTLSWAYTFEWPVFSVLSVIGWWQMVHDDPDRVGQRALRRMRAAWAAHPEGSFDDLDDQASNATTPAGPALDPDPPPGWARSGHRAASPMAPQASRAELDPEEDPELAAYNRYLAGLATTGPRKNWRRS